MICVETVFREWDPFADDDTNEAKGVVVRSVAPGAVGKPGKRRAFSLSEVLLLFGCRPVLAAEGHAIVGC